MRLNKLELHGFKTFAGRAGLEFAPGITAIVGPNGSGKSNVADAVRWVLGEQSIKLLRGRRSEDVIFGGGPGRAPMGMAEVTLTLDNVDGALDPGFTEVAVGRRAFRSGENEYYVNKGRVRLRDVVDLLSRAGIGQNGHSVIGQGLVDLALSLRPEERRGLFEDAAGMRRYQAKKAESETKLAEVTGNATRVADLIADLEPRVGQLLRQARRAQDEVRLRQQWRQAMLAWLAQQRWELEAALAQWQPRADELRRQREAGRAAADDAAAAGGAARARLATARAAAAGAQAERGAAREAAERARRDAAVAGERFAGAQRAEREARAQVQRLEQQLAAGREAVPAALAERERATRGLEAARAEAAGARAALRAQSAPVDADALRAAREAAVECARALTQATTQLREAERQLATTRRQAAEAADGRARAAEALDGLTGQLAALDDAAAAAGERQRTLGEQLHALQARRAETEQRLKTSDRQATALQQEVDALRVRLSVLGDVTRSPVETPAAGTPARTLAQELPVPAEVEAAVAAAAGPALEWVVVDTTSQAAHLATEHARAGGRRTTFVAREMLNQRRRLEYPPLPDHDGGLGYLCDAVAAARGAAVAATNGAHANNAHANSANGAGGLPDGGADRPLHAALLADSYLVRDLETALRLSQGLNGGVRPAIVTLAGELVNSIGAITAGAPPDEAATLQRLRELREAEAALVERQRALAPLLEARAALSAEAAALAREEQALERDLRTVVQQATREEGERRGLTQQRLRLEKDLRWWSDFDARSAGQLSELEGQVATLSVERERAAAAHLEADAHARQLTAAVEERRAREAALRDRAARAETAAAVAEQRLQRAAEQAERAEQAAAATSREVETARRRLEASAADVARLQREAAATGEAVHACEQRLGAAEALLGASRRECDQLEQEIERHRAAAERSAAAAAQAERDAALLEAERATVAERLRALRDHAEREVGELPAAAQSEQGAEALKSRVASLDGRLRALGPVNQVALEEHAEASERLAFLQEQLEDLNRTTASLEAVRADLDAGLERDFGATFQAVAEHFREYFRRLFGGGDAQLILTDPRNLTETGVEIVAQLPGKRKQELALLSGGERALVAASLLFALLKARPSPFCVLDEVDAALDEANVGRFCDVLTELSARTQFVLVTHNRATMERAGALYGITLGADNVSRIVSLRLEEAAAVGGGA